jgi:hypothetical protein
MEVHVTNTTNFKGVVLTGHKGPILSVAMDPKGKYVVSKFGYNTFSVFLKAIPHLPTY